MSSTPVPTRLPSPRERLRRALRHPLQFFETRKNTSYDDILYHAARTRSLDEFIEAFPPSVSAALELSAFQIFLREGSDYVLQQRVGRGVGRVALAAKSATVAGLKRDREPAVFFDMTAPNPQPEAWQMLATPEEIGMLEQLGTQVLLPLEGRMGLIGFASLAREGRRPFTRDEWKFLRELGPQMGQGLESAQFIRSLSEEAVLRARAQRELELAREVQERLLPVRLPQIPGLDAAAAYRSADQVGGDYYDLFPTHGGCFCMVMADVSGKGVAAALLMASLRAFVHTLMLEEGLALTAMMQKLNRLLYSASSSSRYATVFVSIYDPAARTLHYSNGGHNPPMLRRATGEVERLTCGGPVIGLLPELAYDAERLQLGAGDMLVAYTDGVTEACNPQGAEWGEAGLLAALEAGSAAEIAAAVLGRMDAFAAGTPPVDDVTLVVLRGVA